MASKPFASGHVLTAADVNDLTGIYRRRTNEIVIASSVTETDLLAAAGPTALSIGANHLSSDRMLRATILGDVLNNTGVNQNIVWKVKLGGTTIIDDTTGTLGDSGTRRPFRVVVEIANLNATNVQWAAMLVHIGLGTVATVGIGDLNATHTTDALLSTNGTAAIDMTSARNFEVTATLSANSASYSFRKKYAVVELL